MVLLRYLDEGNENYISNLGQARCVEESLMGALVINSMDKLILDILFSRRLLDLDSFVLGSNHSKLSALVYTARFTRDAIHDCREVLRGFLVKSSLTKEVNARCISILQACNIECT